MSLPKVDDWPMWLQVLVLGPHAILAGILLWVNQRRNGGGLGF
jgi:hypothetical protein